MHPEMGVKSAKEVEDEGKKEEKLMHTPRAKSIQLHSRHILDAALSPFAPARQLLLLLALVLHLLGVLDAHLLVEAGFSHLRTCAKPHTITRSAKAR